MFKILNGREHFYQWDLDQILILDDKSITQVHFCNRTDDCALVCEAYELDGMWVVNVPNILLQDNWRIRAYAWDGSATLHEKKFDVVSRSKPESYVYTETEVVTYDVLLERMNKIDEHIGEAVEEYIIANPPEVEVKDSFFIDFSNATETWQECDEEMLEFLEYFQTHDDVCLNIRDGFNGDGETAYFYPAIIQANNKASSLCIQKGAMRLNTLSSENQYGLYMMTTKNGVWGYYVRFIMNYHLITMDNKATALAEYALKSDIPEGGNVDLTGYATEEYVNNAIPDHSVYATKTELKNYAKKSDIPDHSVYALKSEIPSVTGYATKTELKNYAKKSDIPDHSGYALKTDLSTYALKTDLSTYALKSEIPSLTDYAKKSDIPDHSVYALKTDIPTVPDVSAYQTADQVNALITSALGAIGVAEEGAY